MTSTALVLKPQIHLCANSITSTHSCLTLLMAKENVCESLNKYVNMRAWQGIRLGRASVVEQTINADEASQTHLASTQTHTNSSAVRRESPNRGEGRRCGS